ncbi:hypothetical protein JTB14_020313 [Gonioctena quinquepunctata]|nr:hypothetical protein JTB14_020313 [Gonioctena quinquepunctata]
MQSLKNPTNEDFPKLDIVATVKRAKKNAKKEAKNLGMKFEAKDLYTTYFLTKKDRKGDGGIENDDLEIDDSTPQITSDHRNIHTVTEFENFESVDLKQFSRKMKSTN